MTRRGPRMLLARAVRSGCRAHRTREAGFSLVELMIALVAGLSVAMAVVGVSKEATNTFHEEVRVSGAEMGLRVAMERIRMDLQRAAFMSTGNILGDPLVAQNAISVASIKNLSNITGGTIPYSLQSLAGIRLTWKGATIGAAVENNALEVTKNSLTPDLIDIGGNFSTADEYAATIVWPATTGGGAGPCAVGPAISLQMNTPAAWRMQAAEAATGSTGKVLQAIFHPGASTTSQFLLRLTDSSGRYQYLIGAAGGVNGGTYYNTGTLATPNAVVCVSSISTILQTNVTGGNGGVSGLGTGWVVVSPLQVARWDIQSLSYLQGQLTAAGVTDTYTYNVTSTPEANEFVLTRSYLDFSTTCTAASPCPPDYFTTEIIAEYAVDLKFGFVYDTFQNPGCTAALLTAGVKCPVVAPAYGAASTLAAVAMDDATGQASVTGYALLNPATGYVPNQGPQRIRSVQARVGIRTRFADRQVSLAVSGSPTQTPSNYLFRYQLASTVTAGSGALAFARVRESTTDVTLPNQARFFY